MVGAFIFTDVSFISGLPTHLFNSLFSKSGQISKDFFHLSSFLYTALGWGRGSESWQDLLSFTSITAIFQILEHRVLCSYLI